MRKYSILVFFIALTMLSSAGMDTIPPRIEAKAKMKTDSQLASISEPISGDRWIIHFDRLRRHIDSLNAMNTMVRDSAIQAATQRDSVMTALLLTVAENTRLKEENKQWQEDWHFVSQAPNWLYYFLVTVVGCLFALGIHNKYREYKNIQAPEKRS